MANPPKKTVAKPAAKIAGDKARQAGDDTVALTAAQALAAVDKAIGVAPPTKRKYERKAPAAAKAVSKPAPAPKPVAAPVAQKPRPPAPVTPQPKAAVSEPAAPAAPAARPDTKQATVAPNPIRADPIVADPVAPDPVAVAAAPEITVEDQSEEIAAPIAMVPAIPPLVARAEGHVMMNDVIENTKKYTEEAKVRFQSAFSDMSAKAKAATEKSTKAVEEMSDIAKGNVEAIVESGKIAAKGFETMGQDAAEYGRLSFEKATATMKSLAAVKSPSEFFQLQSELMSSAFDGFAKEAAKNSEAMLKLAGDVAQPLSSRVAVITDKVKTLAA